MTIQVSQRNRDDYTAIPLPATALTNAQNHDISIRPLTAEDYAAAALWAQEEIDQYGIPTPNTEIDRHIKNTPDALGSLAAMFEIDNDHGYYRHATIGKDGSQLVLYKYITNWRAAKKMWPNEIKRLLLNGVNLYFEQVDPTRAERLWGTR